MSQSPGQDPGGGPDPGAPPGSSQELSDLKDQFEQQQVLIAQLKEMIRKNEQTNVTQEKVDEYMNTLSKRRAKKSSDNGAKKTLDIPASQKINLLRQQVEQNKVRLAERGKSQKGIEEMVTQLKAQLDDSQHLISQSPLNLSLQDPKIDYSENSNAQELYAVLLTKEKRISDLLAKVQKLETNVLDLQENLKEKDSVIDARTKAITLMTENLSRKGKNTLDTLDETKEQMRKMQENFVALEAEMKARQMKLLEDLRLKNYEIAELQETNANLEKQISEKAEDLELDLKTENSRLLDKIRELEVKLEESQESEEVAKLKKQLEEANKNMIKVKAQHKSKVKELTKKIESFKKMSDANAEIVKLEAENSRLSQKIAELEEEKGSLQLKLVESDSNKGSETERENELENKIQDHERMLEEKDKIISILESEISRSKTEIDNLNEKLNGQVKSEMVSIQFEEQLERVESEKRQLVEENERICKEKEQLGEQLEQLKKEKQEVATKLEHYIQENMELIDKLEKLSAEKVSSAESIEIVENLTQQEKLELEAYHKNLDLVGGNLKASEENLPQVDLNESVNELTEETSELLQKIELFTVERREVMEKMEQLKQENLNLNMKIKEIENNRDVLAETYEQLQSEKEQLDAKLEKFGDLEENSRLNNAIIDLNRTLADLENDNKSLQMKIEQLEESNNHLTEELEIVKNSESENRQLVESKGNEIVKLIKEKENTESVIENLHKTIREKEENFQHITSDFKTKYLNLQKQLNENSSNFEAITAPLEAKIEELTAKNKDQLEKMKKIAANLKKKTQACQDLEDKFKETQARHETSLQQLDEKIEQIKILEEKNVELQNLITEMKVKNEVSLQQELLLTRENLGSVENSLRTKIQELEMIVETQESELVKSKERVNKLEEGLSFVEERRLSLERKANELGAQLEEKEITCEEMTRSEDLLEQRLVALAAHDEAIERKLQEAIVENQELLGRNRELEEEGEKMKKKIEDLGEKFRQLEREKETIEELECENEKLRKQVHDFENELKQTNDMLEESKNDFDKVNADWQLQFDEVFKERTELMIQCEKFAEELKTIAEKEFGFNNELIEYKTKLEKSESEIREYEERIGQLTLEKEEFERLRNLLKEKEVELETKQSEIKQLIVEKDELRKLLSDKEPKPEANSLASFFDNVPEKKNEAQVETIPTFVWSGQTNDPFDFVAQDTKTENTNQELLEKIKTLEFMLYNTEKEKEDALHQCAQLTNELTQLVYEKQMPIESQILQESDIKDTPDTCKQLEKIEFEPTKAPLVSSLEAGPVVEEPIQVKEAYLCYNDDSRNVSIFGENDDGWGCGVEEENVQKSTEHESLNERIRVLELERENHLEEIRQLQVKSGKLIKKLKEFKVKNEELAKKKPDDFFNLDDTIQEELKLQIEQVEKRLKETMNELEKEKNEKIVIAKKVESLSMTNERLVEAKEKQDIELLGWQQQNRELSAKLEQFEWGDDSFTTEEKPTVVSTNNEDLAKKIQELNETIKDLTLDNEELQALLEEQRRLRIESEKTTVDPEVLKHLQQQLTTNCEEKKQLQEQINELIRKNDELSEKFETIEQQKAELDELVSSKDETIVKLNETLRGIEEEVSVLTTELQEKNSQIEALKTSFEAQDDREKLANEIEEKMATLKTIESEKQLLFNELQEKNIQINTLRESVDSQIGSLKDELDNQIKIAQNLLEEKTLLSETLKEKESEVVRLSATMEQMTQEWDLRIDQRGNDVAESWKLHLESRESEFTQIEQLLRKEINELEEKCNALVNENNELRKNVDAEIRNEVDRVAALQQQINDRQQYINELTKTLQEKQREVEGIQMELETTKQSLEIDKEIVDGVLHLVVEFYDGGVTRDHSLIKVLKDRENVIIGLKTELESLKTRFEDIEVEKTKGLEDVQRLRVMLEEREQTIAGLTSQVSELQNLKDYENENVQNLQQNLHDYQQINNNLSAQVQAQVAQIEAKDRELDNLRHLVEEKQRECDYAVENLTQEYRVTINEQVHEIEVLKRRLSENENRYEELLHSKESDLEGVQYELNQVMVSKSKEIEGLASQLNTKIEECESLQRKIEEQVEETKQLTELRAIIEEQVLKIEELKKDLYEKSNDYDSLIAEMDISRTNVKAPEAAPPPKTEETEDLTEPVSRAELDLALYMLHQRDVRCEELTVELTQLLEERDTLQLRLSNVLREKEELGRKVGGEGGSLEVLPKPVEVESSLTDKLSELKTVGYKKDKTIVDEQETRRLQQLSIMQQHRDVASRLPPEAAARLVDASYTLSRDVQSPSKVLLNWLWGRSTPRVNNI
ncbi:protein lava lamp [Tribolium castaneum]|uniref:Uncharacterized protein n=1 Tax=Tribolium castaneum TaxID=7070 RepID=D2A2A0_TRICA|nr:PREDICTED: protein lava lamp [Tribolium castaneum]EFA02160.2 hypothetical protein TcasGA2_TC007813 [Tribolium castaneum]|eukprot:XP_015834363.1 PREDICTED: protein lava lamp [Tribolium castaneum]